MKILGGLTLDAQEVKASALTGDIDLSELVVLEWNKLKTEPPLAQAIESELKDLDEGVRLHELKTGDNGVRAILAYQPSGFPFPVPIETTISREGIDISLVSIRDAAIVTVCTEIRRHVLDEQPELYDGARIVDVPESYCRDQGLRGLELHAQVDFPSLGPVPLKILIHADTGIRVLPPDLRGIIGQMLDLYGVEALKLAPPYVDDVDGVTIYVDGKVPTPIGLTLQAGFSASPRRLALRGPIGVRIPGWFDGPVVSVGRMGVTYDPTIKILALLGSVSIVPGIEMSKLVRIDGRGELNFGAQELKVTGNLKVVQLIDVASSTTRISIPERLFEHRMQTSPTLADLAKLQGQLRIQDLPPNPFLAASGVGGVLGADIAKMDVEIQRNLGGFFKAGLHVPLSDDPSGMAFEVTVDPGLSGAALGADHHIDLGPISAGVGMNADTKNPMVSVVARAKVKGIQELRVAFPIPGFAVLTPEYLLDMLLDFELVFHMPSSVSTSSAPDGGGTEGRGGAGRVGAASPPDQPPAVGGGFSPAWRPVAVEKKECVFGLNFWCETWIEHEPRFLPGRPGQMAKAANYSERSAERHNLQFRVADSGALKHYDLLADGRLGRRLFVFERNGPLIWAGKYSGDLGNLASVPVAHKTRAGSTVLVAKTGNQFYGLMPQDTLNTTAQQALIENVGTLLANDSEFGRLLAPNLAEEQLYNGRRTPVVDIGRSKKWALVNMSKGGKVTPVLVQMADENRGMKLAFLEAIDATPGGSGPAAYLKGLSAEGGLSDTLDAACTEQDSSSLSRPCAYIAVGQKQGGARFALGLDASNRASPQLLLATKTKAWNVAVDWPPRYSASTLAGVERAAIADLMNALMHPNALDRFTTIESATLDLSESARIGLVGKRQEGGDAVWLMFTPRDVILDDSRNRPRLLDMKCVNRFWNGDGEWLRPSEDALRDAEVGDKGIAVMRAMVHKDAFKKYGFAADPAGSLYQQCGQTVQ